MKSAREIGVVETGRQVPSEIQALLLTDPDIHELRIVQEALKRAAG